MMDYYFYPTIEKCRISALFPVPEEGAPEGAIILTQAQQDILGGGLYVYDPATGDITIEQ